jgi:hypothetical protein
MTAILVPTIRHWIAAALLSLTAAPAAMAQGQDLGHKILGGVGLDAGTQPDPGIYVGDRFVYYRADELKDRDGERVPVRGLEVEALANVVGISGTLKLGGAPYLGAAVAIPYAWLSLRSDAPQASIDRSGIGDVFVEPIKVGFRLPHLDVVTSYSFYAPTGQAEDSGVGQRQWSQQFSAGGTVFLDDRRAWRLSALGSYNLYNEKIGIDIRRGDTVQIQGGIGGRLFDVIDFGLAGYVLRQVEDDSGADLPPVLRGAREEVFGLGPEIGVAIPAIRARLTIRYERDLGARSRPEGQILVAGLSFVAWRPD